VGLQERLDPMSQLDVAVAFAVQNCAAVREIMMTCSLKEYGLDALRVQRHGMLLPLDTRGPFHTYTRRLQLALSNKIEKKENWRNVLERKGCRELKLRKAPIGAHSTSEFVDQEGMTEKGIGMIVQSPRTSPSQARA
jgi:hypothetical protein